MSTDEINSLATKLIIYSDRLDCTINRADATKIARALLAEYEIEPKETPCLIAL